MIATQPYAMGATMTHTMPQRMDKGAPNRRKASRLYPPGPKTIMLVW